MLVRNHAKGLCDPAPGAAISLAVRDLRVEFRTYLGIVRALRGVNLDLLRGAITGIVGETGSGKSVTARSVLGLIRPPGYVVGGTIVLEGHGDLLAKSERQMAAIRGSDVAMAVQNARASLNPVFTIGDQMHMILREHDNLNRSDAHHRIVDLLRAVRIADPEKRLKAYPHELSTGMCQRVSIAMALSCNPKLLIADEPTTGLDVTVQAQILVLFRELVASYESTAAIITHNLGVVAETCKYVAIMYAGQVVEYGSTADVFDEPRHPYTRGLLASTLSGLQSRSLHHIPGLVPNMIESIPGCAFANRCSQRLPQCSHEPPSECVFGNHRVGCHLGATVQ